MSQNDTDPGDLSSQRLPLWAQLSLGLAFLVLVYITAVTSTTYISAWDREDSNYYTNALEGLKVKGINPSAPTLIAFWEQGCEDCRKNIRFFSKLPSSIRPYAIHLYDKNLKESDLRQQWVSLNPGVAQLVYDETELLQTSFRVRGGAMVFLILPKDKALYSYWGEIEDNYERLSEIIKESYHR